MTSTSTAALTSVWAALAVFCFLFYCIIGGLANGLGMITYDEFLYGLGLNGSTMILALIGMIITDCVNPSDFKKRSVVYIWICTYIFTICIIWALGYEITKELHLIVVGANMCSMVLTIICAIVVDIRSRRIDPITGIPA